MQSHLYGISGLHSSTPLQVKNEMYLCPCDDYVFLSYPVQSTERHIDRQRKQILDHFLESFHQLLLVRLNLLQLEAQQDPHGYAEHQPLHLWVDQYAGVPRQPLLHSSTHLLLDDGDVELQSFSGERPHDGLEKDKGVNGWLDYENKTPCT